MVGAHQTIQFFILIIIIVVDSIPVQDPLAVKYPVKLRGRNLIRIRTVWSTDMRRWNVPRSRSTISVAVAVVVLDD